MAGSGAAAATEPFATSQLSQCRLQLVATLVERSAMRYTPGGAQALEMRIRHVSRQHEGGLDRDIDWEMDALVIGPSALALSDVNIGAVLRLSGFLAPRRKGGRVLRFHVTECESQPPG